MLQYLKLSPSGKVKKKRLKMYGNQYFIVPRDEVLKVCYDILLEISGVFRGPLPPPSSSYVSNLMFVKILIFKEYFMRSLSHNKKDKSKSEAEALRRLGKDLGVYR